MIDRSRQEFVVEGEEAWLLLKTSTTPEKTVRLRIDYDVVWLLKKFEWRWSSRGFAYTPDARGAILRFPQLCGHRIALASLIAEHGMQMDENVKMLRSVRAHGSMDYRYHMLHMEVDELWELAPKLRKSLGKSDLPNPKN